MLPVIDLAAMNAGQGLAAAIGDDDQPRGLFLARVGGPVARTYAKVLARYGQIEGSA